MGNKSITVALADDHQVVREGLKALLNSHEGFQVVGEAGSGIEATQLVEQLKPDVLILDLMMKDMNGIEVTRQLAKRSSSTRIIILSMHGTEAYVVESLRAGASGYVLKESSASELTGAIETVFDGQRYLSPALSERAIEVYIEKAEESPADPYDMLTSREREVLHMACQGLTSTQIADQLLIGKRTVETHRNSLMRKLGLKNQVELIRYAINQGIIPADL